MSLPQNSIPNYDLYGEMGDLPDVVHCEAISTRAAMHDWVIKAHRHTRLHQFFYVQAGGVQYNIEGRQSHVSAPQVLNIPAQTVHGFAFEVGTRGWVITVPLEVLDLSASQTFTQALNTQFQFEPESALVDLFNEIAREHAGRRIARAHILRAQILALSGHIVRVVSEEYQNGEPKLSSPLVRKFEELVEQHYRDHWQLAEYASRLAVTTTHLTRTTKQRTGLPASKLIEARLVREARRNLAYTTLTISEIAYRIGYTDPAYFTRVFTRATGVSPGAFRKKLEP